jgi:hypothetical protein
MARTEQLPENVRYPDPAKRPRFDKHHLVHLCTQIAVVAAAAAIVFYRIELMTAAMP